MGVLQNARHGTAYLKKTVDNLKPHIISICCKQRGIEEFIRTAGNVVVGVQVFGFTAMGQWCTGRIQRESGDGAPL
jgi:hypothetical protein